MLRGLASAGRGLTSAAAHTRAAVTAAGAGISNLFRRGRHEGDSAETGDNGARQPPSPPPMPLTMTDSSDSELASEAPPSPLPSLTLSSSVPSSSQSLLFVPQTILRRRSQSALSRTPPAMRLQACNPGSHPHIVTATSMPTQNTGNANSLSFGAASAISASAAAGAMLHLGPASGSIPALPPAATSPPLLLPTAAAPLPASTSLESVALTSVAALLATRMSPLPSLPLLPTSVPIASRAATETETAPRTVSTSDETVAINKPEVAGRVPLAFVAHEIADATSRNDNITAGVASTPKDIVIVATEGITDIPTPLIPSLRSATATSPISSNDNGSFSPRSSPSSGSSISSDPDSWPQDTRFGEFCCYDTVRAARLEPWRRYYSYWNALGEGGRRVPLILTNPLEATKIAREQLAPTASEAGNSSNLGNSNEGVNARSVGTYARDIIVVTNADVGNRGRFVTRDRSNAGTNSNRHTVRGRFVWQHPSQRLQATAIEVTTTEAVPPTRVNASTATDSSERFTTLAITVSPAVHRIRSILLPDIAGASDINQVTSHAKLGLVRQSLPLWFVTLLYPLQLTAAPGQRDHSLSTLADVKNFVEDVITPRSLARPISESADLTNTFILVSNSINRTSNGTESSIGVSSAIRSNDSGENKETEDDIARAIAKAKAKANGRRLVMSQGHWQYSTTSVVLGTLRQSSIVKDQRRSGLNKVLADKLDRATRAAEEAVEVSKTYGIVSVAASNSGSGGITPGTSDVRVKWDGGGGFGSAGWVTVDDVESNGSDVAVALLKRAELLQKRGLAMLPKEYLLEQENIVPSHNATENNDKNDYGRDSSSDSNRVSDRARTPSSSLAMTTTQDDLRVRGVFQSNEWPKSGIIII